jgi:hypothetical protein
MAYVSPTHAAFMRANHPEIARRWSIEDASTTGQRQNFKPSERRVPGKPGAGVPRRLPGVQRDFSKLTPGDVARHTRSKAASEHEAMQEGGVQAQPGARAGHMNLKGAYTGFAKRDVAKATLT